MPLVLENVNQICPVCGGELRNQGDHYYCPYCRKKFVATQVAPSQSAPGIDAPKPEPKPEDKPEEKPEAKPEKPAKKPDETPAPEGPKPLTPKQIFAKAVPSVAVIIAGDSRGSGFCVCDSRYIVTNAHVIDSAWKAGEKNVQVVIADKPYNGRLYARGSSNGLDLAIIVLDDKHAAKPLKVCKDHVVVGEDVYALGNSMGDGTIFVHGMISDDERYYNKAIPDAILCDISTNPGNSGGPLLNDRGELIGACVAQRIDNDGSKSVAGMRYFIPLKYILKFVKDSMEDED